MSFSTFDTILFFLIKTGQPWTKELGIQSFNKGYDEIHEATLVCTVDGVQLKPHHEGVTIKPSSYFAHTCPDISSRGPYQQPSDYHTKLEGLTKHPQHTYPTRGPYHPPSFLTVNRGPYHNPRLPNQQEGLTNHPYIHNKNLWSVFPFRLNLRFYRALQVTF